METMTGDAFLTWAAERGIGPDPRFPDAPYLTVLRGTGEGRFWEYPTERDAPYFIKALIDAIGPDVRYWIYPANGYWEIDPSFAGHPPGRVWRTVLAGLGLPMPAVGAVGVGAGERDALLAMLFLQVTLGPAIHVDSTVIPEDGSAVLFFEHHGVVHARCQEPSKLQSAIGVLATAGYSLPTEAPDATFKPVQWIRSKDK